MTDTWRLLRDDGATAAGGLALDEALTTSHRRNEPDRPPTVRLYTYATHCALVGRYQHLTAEVDVEACDRTATAYNRRPTGGGAIVMGAGQLGVAICDRARPNERPKEVIARFADGIVRGLAELGIEATFRGKNDLEVSGRKIAGLGLYLDPDGGQLFHASVLSSLDVPFMLRVLRIPAAKLGDEGVTAVNERVTTVSRETGEAWTAAALRDVIATGYEKAFGVRLVAAEPTETEVRLAADLERTKYQSPDWLFQRTPHPDAQGTALFKTPAGLVRVYLALDGGTIKSALFAGDFNDMPPELTELEGALKWTRVDRTHAIIQQVWTRTQLGVGADVVAGAVAEAAARAGARTASAPDREGSCYFPEVR